MDTFLTKKYKRIQDQIKGDEDRSTLATKKMLELQKEISEISRQNGLVIDRMFHSKLQLSLLYKRMTVKEQLIILREGE